MKHKSPQMKARGADGVDEGGIGRQKGAWRPDILGPDYQALTLELGGDPDGEGEVAATLVRYCPDNTPRDGRPALLWVHGMTDYFFHDHLAKHFDAAGYAFYALDLRKCGRSHTAGQSWHYASDLELYFADLDAALTELTDHHPSVVPMAHSTGGIIVPLWLDYLRTQAPARHERIGGLVLNSPWLDIMGVPTAVVRAVAPLVNVVGRLAPRIPFPGGGLTAYGESLHAELKGEWHFSTTFKPITGHRKYLGWLRAVMAGQRRIHHDDVDVGVPCLVLCSVRSQLGQPYSATTDTADTIVDTRDIHRWAPHLGKDVDIYPILGARHDVFLSLAPALAEALKVTDNWLDHHCPAQAG